MSESFSHGTIELPYRAGVGAVIVNKSNKIFAGQRIDTLYRAWQMPQGGINQGESPINALKRELVEEIGTRNLRVIDQVDRWLYYDLPKDVIPKIWSGQFKGQKQKWFILRFIGEDKEINIKTKKPEFGAWRWMSKNELLKSIVSFKRELYKNIFQEFDSILN
ncbi:MAG: RNA pyrophosphohydrolase [Pseudomonadota bacterium]|nr:RNA pyrophosphohydrolase [Pseudomonadota bacterium]MEC8876852.1 RNA pyrophosphohydrolase [Pseudomonadota bacterium]MEE3207244.1 RNA pyrophosphohydrolase [Pseudomonadota bacterium]MEE3261065.1 RNA pyrophosphohydrolase [Pseudomonadota bacterium]